MALPQAQQRETEYAPQRAPVKSLHVLSSGTVEQHKEHRYGTKMPLMWWVLTSRSWVKAPIHYFLIEHRDGLVLFDTGLDPAIKTDPKYISQAIGRFLLHRIFRIHITEEDRLDKVLTRASFSAKDVRTAVISHLHFDHVGGISEIGQAKLLVSAQEWARLSEPRPEHDWFLKEHIELPTAQWSPIDFVPTDDPLLESFDGTYDVAGDGSMVLVPTPGHTPGSLSMLIRSDDMPPVLLIGDLAYEEDMLIKNVVPGLGDPAVLRQTYAKIGTLKEYLPDLVIVPSHDSKAAEIVAGLLPGRKGQGGSAE